jgi:alkylhydroperoxidase family enzyme
VPVVAELPVVVVLQEQPAGVGGPPDRAGAAGGGQRHAERELVRGREQRGTGAAERLHHRAAHVLYALPVWRETPFFTARERAALAFTEAVTPLATDHVPATAYDAVAAEFGPDEIAALFALIVVINAWTAVGVTSRAWQPGSYQP